MHTWIILAVAALAIGLLLSWSRLRHRPAQGAVGRRRLVLGGLLAPWFSGLRAQPGPNPPGEAGRPLAVLWLQSEVRQVQAADFVSPMFGQPFRQGDMPAGRHPRFVLADGTACPATLWGITSWPDGSMKFCAAMLRVPREIAGGDRLEVQVRVGDPQPATGPRRVDDLLAADLRVELTGVDGLEGVWTTALNDGVRRRDDLVLIGNGAAGAVWRIGAELRNERGAAHGQLYCWHYVAALNGADDRLLGLRYLGRVAQPWADVATPAPRHRDCSATLKSGTNTLRQLLGHVDSETPGEVIRLLHYASFCTAGPDARWDFVQGAGSASADCTVRVLMDVPYAQRSDLVPPVVLGGTAQEPPVHHHPMGRGGMVRYMPQTGGRSDIGLMPLWCVRYLAHQSDANERAVRVNALVAAGWRIAYRKRATRQVVPVSDIKPQYAGLGPSEKGWRIHGEHGNGFVKPAPVKALWSEDAAHRPQPFVLAYLMTGEPQYLDMAVDNALVLINGLAPGVRTVVTSFPTQRPTAVPWVGDRDVRIGTDGPVFKCAGQMFIGGRIAAWGTRDTAICALLPDTPPDGAAVRAYMRDIMASMYGALLAYRDRMPRAYSDSGLMILESNGGNDRAYESPWQTMYWSYAMCWQSAVFKTPESAAVRRYFLQFWKRSSELFDIGCAVTYRMAQYDHQENMITRLEDAVFLARRRLQFDAATDTITVLPRQGQDIHDWTPTDGDLFAFSPKQMAGAPDPFPQLGRNRRLYVVRAQGQSFQLSATRGGAPLDIVRDELVTQFMGQFQNMDVKTMFANDPTYIALLRGLLIYHERLGDPATEVRAKYEPKALAAGFDPRVPSQFNIAEPEARR
jgi:hypothetical protein